MDALFLRVLTTACVISLLLVVLLFPARAWFTTRYAPQVRWTLWRGLGIVLILGVFFSGFAAIPQTRWALPSYSVTIPAPTLPTQKPQHNSNEFTSTSPDAVPSLAPTQIEGTNPLPDSPSDPQLDTPDTVQPVPTRSSLTVSTTWILGIVWLTGAVVVLLWQAIRYLWARKKLLRASHPTTVFDCLVSEAVHRPVSVRVLHGLDTPMTLGILRSVVLLPQEQVPLLSLRHELTHIQRRDLLGKALLLVVCALYWFDPLVWYMSHVAGQDMEAACDGQLARDMTPEEKRAYGELLLSAAAKESSPALSTHFGGSKEQLKSRLTQLFRPGKTSRVLVCVLLCSTVVLSSLMVGQSAAVSSPDSETQVLFAAYADIPGTDDGTIALHLVDFVPGADWMGSTYDTVTYHLAEDIQLTDEEDQVDTLSEFLNRHELQFTEGDSTYYNLLRVEVESDTITAMSWYLGVAFVGGTLWQDPECSQTFPYVLQLPESWRDNFDAVSTLSQGDAPSTLNYQVKFYDKDTQELLLTLNYQSEDDFETAHGSDTALQEAQGIYILYHHDSWVFWVQASDTPNQLAADFLAQEHDPENRGHFYWLGSASYTSTRYGFTLSLPESWRTLFYSQEGLSSTDFYTADMGKLASLVVRTQPASQEELDTGLVELSHGENGWYVYLSVAEPPSLNGFRDSVQGMQYFRLCQDLRESVEQERKIITFFQGEDAVSPLFPPDAEANPDVRAAYAQVLENLLQENTLPDGSVLAYEYSNLYGYFALADINHDGQEELILYADEIHGYILGYDQDTAQVQILLEGSPNMEFYSDGVVKLPMIDIPRNYTVYQYQQQADPYQQMAKVTSWVQQLEPTNENGDPFPTWIDISGTGTVYYVESPKSQGTDPMDQSNYLVWVEETIPDSQRLTLDFLSLSQENIDALKE